VFVALVIQHAMRMRHVILSSVAIFFHIISFNSTIFRKNLMNTKCMFCFSLQLLSETFLILRISERNIIYMYIGLHVKYPLFLSDSNDT